MGFNHERITGVPVNNAGGEKVGEAVVYQDGRVDINIDGTGGVPLFDMIREGMMDGLTLKGNPVPSHPLNAGDDDIFEGKQLKMPIPRVGFMGVELSKSGLNDAWTSIIVPMQDEGKPLSMEWQIIMAVMRSVHGAMPEDN